MHVRKSYGDIYEHSHTITYMRSALIFILFSCFNHYLYENSYNSSLLESRREKTVFQAPDRLWSFLEQARSVLMGIPTGCLIDIHSANFANARMN